MSKLTLAGYKKFCRENKDRLYFKRLSNFDGMVDCVMPTNNPKLIRVENVDDLFNNKIGWLVGMSRDHFEWIENGIEVFNCCGSFQVLALNDESQDEDDEVPAINDWHERNGFMPWE